METEPETHLTFGPFHLDVAQGRLWRGIQVLTLRRRSMAMLCYLAEHPGRLVTKAELRQHVWGGTHVTDTVLRVCVQEIRAVLGDAADAPRYLATVGRQGYRFLVGDDHEATPPLLDGPIVGRQHEIDALASWFQRAAQGTRQFVFVSGQAGVGKTTVVDRWLARLSAERGVRTVWGQCVEHSGEGEPYLPLLEALGQLSHGPDHRGVQDVMRRYAPTWLVQWPGLLPEAELERLQRRLQGATSARMLREVAEALEVLTAETPLVLILEDLHWSDRATVECLNYVAQRRMPAQLLVLGTYRPVEAAIQQHPLRHIVQELCGRRHAVELRLELLTSADVTAYVSGRLGGPVSPRLAAFVYERTEGHALFLVNIVEHLVRQGLVVRRAGEWTLQERDEVKVASLPEGLRQLLVRRLEELPSEARRVLEAASVAGEQFMVAAVAATIECPEADVEAQCEALAAQRQFLDDIGVGERPDGTSSGRYRFAHALYRQVLYEGLGTVRRRQLHRRMGMCLEGAYGAQAREVAPELAVHFERGGEIPRAIHYWQHVGDTAARRNADGEALAAMRRGLKLLVTLPESPERSRQQLALQLALGELLRATKGIGARDVGEVYSQAYALCQQTGETALRVRALWGLSQFQMAQGQLAAADELTQQLLELAQRQPDTGFLVEGHFLLGTMAFYRADFLAARSHLEQSWRLSDTVPSSSVTLRGGFLRGVTPRTSLARVLWALGYADQAQQRSREAMVIAQQGEHLPSLAYAECFVALVCQCCRDLAATQAHADALLALAAAQNWPLRAEQGRILRGWALAMQGEAAAGVTLLRQGLASSDVGPEHLRPHWLALLAEAHGRAGQPQAGLQILAEAVALMETTQMWWSEAEMFRLQGELQLQLPKPEVSQAESCFQQALTVARRQQAKALELRAALSLGRLWQQRGQRQAARELLAPIYAWFTEGFDTTDVREARVLLAELA